MTCFKLSLSLLAANHSSLRRFQQVRQHGSPASCVRCQSAQDDSLFITDIPEVLRRVPLLISLFKLDRGFLLNQLILFSFTINQNMYFSSSTLYSLYCNYVVIIYYFENCKCEKLYIAVVAK